MNEMKRLWTIWQHMFRQKIMFKNNHDKKLKERAKSINRQWNNDMIIYRKMWTQPSCMRCQMMFDQIRLWVTTMNYDQHKLLQFRLTFSSL